MLTFGLLTAQTDQLILHGKILNLEKIVPLVNYEIIQNNETIEEGVTSQNGSFQLKLELGSVYDITFSKDGYVTKQVGVIAKYPDTDITGRYFFQMDLEFFKIDEDRLDETMLPPVAKLYIKEPSKGFTYDKDYVKWVSNQFEDLD
jgi:hypothetical protein